MPMWATEPWPWPRPGATPAAVDLSELFAGTAAFAGLLALLALGLWGYRRWMLKSDDAAAGSGWNRARLAAMRDAGRLTQAEYERLRALEMSRLGVEREGDR